MKKFPIIMSLALFFAACGGNQSGSTGDKDSTATAATAATPTTPAENPDYEKGLNLIAKSDCFTCHKIKEASTGPAYIDVAKKYEATDANINLLADKIIAGGTGVWGQIPMSPHPALSKEDATSMVKYVLLLKDEK